MLVVRRLRPSEKKLLLVASPFPLLWLWLGLTTHSAVFTPWRTGQSINPLSAMVLSTVPIFFTVIYLVLVAVSRAIYGGIRVRTVIVCSLIAYAMSFVLTPIP